MKHKDYPVSSDSLLHLDCCFSCLSFSNCKVEPELSIAHTFKPDHCLVSHCSSQISPHCHFKQRSNGKGKITPCVVSVCGSDWSSSGVPHYPRCSLCTSSWSSSLRQSCFAMSSPTWQECHQPFPVLLKSFVVHKFMCQKALQLCFDALKSTLKLVQTSSDSLIQQCLHSHLKILMQPCH